MFDDSDVGYIAMLVTKKDISDILRHVGDMPIGNQHTHIWECDVGDRFVMLETYDAYWWT